MISCRSLTKRFGDFTAVDGLTLEVAPGTICAFLGPNGAGKSTTVKMLTGLLAPTSGEATIGGLHIRENSLRIKHKIGVLPENLGLFDDLTVEEHLKLNGEIYRVPGQVAHARIEQLLRALALDPARHTLASECSHGMRKKTAFAMALLPNPEVLFLDEPFEAIDPVSARAIRNLLAQFTATGSTIVFSSHVMELVERLCDHVAVLARGRIVWAGPLEQLRGDGTLEDAFVALVGESDERPELSWFGTSHA
jgi:ABC-2 type transport system ATP-binding protein